MITITSRKSKEISTIVFDLFGTLVISQSNRYREIWGVIGGYDAYVVNYKEYLSTHHFPSVEDALLDITGKEGVELTDRKRDRFMTGLDEWERTTRLYAGARSLLEGLRTDGYQVALLSNQSIFSAGVAGRRDLLQYFDVVIRSHEVGLAKPSDEIYQLTLNELDVLPEEALMIGDDFDCDVIGPLSVGMKGILFDPRNEHHGFEPRVRCWNDFKERYA